MHYACFQTNLNDVLAEISKIMKNYSDLTIETQRNNRHIYFVVILYLLCRKFPLIFPLMGVAKGG